MSVTFDPLRHTATVLGNVVQGWVSVKAARNEDAFSIHVSTDGKVARVRNANKSGRMEVTLTNESPTNDIFMAIAASDELLGVGVGPSFIKDGNGTALCMAAESWFVKIADYERQKELGEVTWIIETDNLELRQGGITNIPGQ